MNIERFEAINPKNKVLILYTDDVSEKEVHMLLKSLKEKGVGPVAIIVLPADDRVIVTDAREVSQKMLELAEKQEAANGETSQ